MKNGMKLILLVWSSIASTFSVFVIAGFLVWDIYYSDKDALSYITNERVSLLDWGITRVDRVLGSAETPLLKKHKSVVYFKNGNILVGASTAWDKAENGSTGVAWCKGLIREIREFFLVDPSSGQPKLGPHSSVSVYFQHNFYPAPDDPERFAESIDRLVQITALVHVEGEGKRVECEAPLIDGEIKLVNQNSNE